jgi:uncharacterized membrane protein
MIDIIKMLPIQLHIMVVIIALIIIILLTVVVVYRIYKNGIHVKTPVVEIDLDEED